MIASHPTNRSGAMFASSEATTTGRRCEADVDQEAPPVIEQDRDRGEVIEHRRQPEDHGHDAGVGPGRIGECREGWRRTWRSTP
jgi:hypothetical protein